METQEIVVAKKKFVSAAAPVKMPVIYEEACRALVECRTLDEAKYFADKAEALAAWAKIYHNDQVSLEAKRLRLHAYRRMSELAQELRPRRALENKHGCHPGARSVLRGLGFSEGTAARIRNIGSLPQDVFDGYVTNPLGCPSPSKLIFQRKTGSAAWNKYHNDSGSPTHFRSFCRTHSAKDLALDFTASEAAQARECAMEITEWLDEFDRFLMKPR